jgi:hypothetical protein
MATLWVENLDSMNERELRAYAGCLNARKYHMTGENRRAAELLIRYAENKADAVLARLRGYVPLALHLEQVCERTYEELPEGVRW